LDIIKRIIIPIPLLEIQQQIVNKIELLNELHYNKYSQILTIDFEDMIKITENIPISVCSLKLASSRESS
jgi:restriction endonuclease S subunit